MTIREIYFLKHQKLTEEAYDAIRQIYAQDKSHQATVCMFWVAVDVLQKRLGERRFEEAQKIYQALERVLSRMDDETGKAHSVLENMKCRLERAMSAANDDVSPHIFMGEWGEELAVSYLREKGYLILERNWRSGHRDIDIVAVDGDTLVFVEVKTRSSADYGAPELAVSYRKQLNLRRAIGHYVSSHHVQRRWRFDVITVVGAFGSNVEINHLDDFALAMR